MNRLFVYGTLAPGKQNHDVLSGLAGQWECATANGTLITESWGSGHGCPGFIPAGDAPEVQGYVFTSDDLTKNWDMLDTFEGEDYKRELISVSLDSGTEAEAYVYSISSSARL